MIRALIITSLGLVPLPALAGCPEFAHQTPETDALITAIQGADTEYEAQQLNDQLWALWTDAPDETAQMLLNEGMSARSSYDYIRALDRFSKLVDYCPDYAEGYNQRAFINFLREDYEAALPDLDKALSLNPTHIGAYSGLALTLFGLDRYSEGAKVLREALELNPWLSERHLLQELPGEEL